MVGSHTPVFSPAGAGVINLSPNGWMLTGPIKETKRERGNLNAARALVGSAKVALGERGPVWWEDGSPDFNRYHVRKHALCGWALQLKAPERHAYRETIGT
jgi:hypothetical protein